MNSKLKFRPSNLRVGRVAPRAPRIDLQVSFPHDGAHGVTRPTSRFRFTGTMRDLSRGAFFGILLAAFALVPSFPALAEENAIRLLVKWEDGPNSPAAAAGNAQIGSTVKRNFSAIGWQLVELPPGMTASDGLKAYHQLGTVVAVEPDGRMAIHPPLLPATNSTPRPITIASQTPDDPHYPEQWHLPKIGAPTAWDVTTGSSNVVVAIIDTGVDYRNPDLAPNMWRNPGETGLDDQGRDKSTNRIDDDNNGYVDDVHGVDVVSGTGDPMDSGIFTPPNAPFYHGTFIAGMIGAVGNNGLGIAGLNWSVKLMAIRFLDANFQNYTVTRNWSGALAAWDYLLMMKRRGVNIRITNNSYGNYQESAALRDTIAQAGQEGILTVAAAGNAAGNTDVFSTFPAFMSLDSVVTVAATTDTDALAGFSNFGSSTVDLAAPGADIFSLSISNTYVSGSGTSFACPCVVGAAALLLAVEPALSVNQLKAALFGSVDQPASLRGRVATNGRLNIWRALSYLTNANAPAIVVTALPGGQRTPTNAPIQVTFNRAMNRSSVESNLVIEPATTGSFEWADDHGSFLFRPGAPLNSLTNYTVKILGTAQDAAGGTLDGDFDRIREGSPADDYVWNFRFPIPNDDFANAQSFSGSSGSIQASNRYATCEVIEPDHVGDRTSTSSVWYRWTAPQNGWFTFDLTVGTAFDSLLAIYSGEFITDLTAIATNDNHGTLQGSRVSFEVAAGTPCFIAVAGKSAHNGKYIIAPNQWGQFQMRWYPTPPPSFTGSQFYPPSGAPGAKITLNGTNFTGTTAILFNGISTSFTNAVGNNTDLRTTAFVPLDATSGPITVVTPHGNVTSASSFNVLPPDVTPPSLVRVTALAPATTNQTSTVALFFDEEVEQASAETVANYSINAGAVTIISAVLRADLKSVQLITAPLSPGTNYQVTVRNVTDRFPNSNAISAATRTFQATSLVLHLTFDDPLTPGANVAGVSEEGALIAEPLVVPGVSGHALSFDGANDYVEVPYSANLGITGDITLAAWIKRGTFNEYRTIVAKSNGRNLWDYDLYFAAGENTLRFWSDRQSPQEVASTGSVANQSWSHVAVTRRGGTVTFYINGAPAGTASVSGNFADNPFPVFIGTDDLDFGETTMFKGQLDDVRIYNQALSALELRKLTIPPLAISFAGGNVAISWTATGITYVLETSGDLSGGLWSSVVQTPIVQNGQNRVTLSVQEPKRFYRLRRN